MAAKTRRTEHVWLIGFPTDGILGSKLPSGRDVMRFSSSIENISAHATYDELIKIWNRCRLPVKSKSDIIDKIESIYKHNNSL